MENRVYSEFEQRVIDAIDKKYQSICSSTPKTKKVLKTIDIEGRTLQEVLGVVGNIGIDYTDCWISGEQINYYVYVPFTSKDAELYISYHVNKYLLDREVFRLYLDNGYIRKTVTGWDKKVDALPTPYECIKAKDYDSLLKRMALWFQRIED